MDETLNTGVNEQAENAVENTATEENKEQLYSAADVQAMIDRRVTQALQTQQKKFEKQLSLSKLDETERAKAEKDSRIAELEEQLAQFTIERNKSELKSVLSARGLSAEYADIITITEDVEANQATIDKLDKLVKATVKAEVEKRLGGTAPKGNTAPAAEMTKDQLLKMPMAEQAKLLETNPELYNKIINN